MKIPDEVQVALVAAACIILIAVVMKNVLMVEADFFVANSPSYVFIVYLLTRGMKGKSRHDSPLYWSIAIAAVTVAVIALYAL